MSGAAELQISEVSVLSAAGVAAPGIVPLGAAGGEIAVVPAATGALGGMLGGAGGSGGGR